MTGDSFLLYGGVIQSSSNDNVRESLNSQTLHSNIQEWPLSLTAKKEPHLSRRRLVVRIKQNNTLMRDYDTDWSKPLWIVPTHKSQTGGNRDKRTVETRTVQANWKGGLMQQQFLKAKQLVLDEEATVPTTNHSNFNKSMVILQSNSNDPQRQPLRT